jgi:transposase
MEDGVAVVEGASERRRYWSAEEKRRIVEQTLSSGLSVASLARQHGMNANQLFYWRKLYRAGQLGSDERSADASVQLLPVSVDGDEPFEPEASRFLVVRWSALRARLMRR